MRFFTNENWWKQLNNNLWITRSSETIISYIYIFLLKEYIFSLLNDIDFLARWRETKSDIPNSSDDPNQRR